jgi:RNA polymerase sigma-70 factor, ECF subfamily
MDMERDERVLELSRLRQGDAGAFHELVATCGPRLLGAAERLGHAPHEAEDLVQDVFLALVRSVDKFEGRSEIFTWLYRVLLNRHAELVRRTVRERSRTPSLPDAEGPPDVERGERVRAAMIRLREEEQRVLFLRFFEGLPYDEIARVVEAPLGTVHAQAFHGLRRLRALLEDES